MPVKVFFNNSCNICKLEIDHYKKNSDENLEWIDITNNQQAVDLTSKSKEELLRRLHVIDNGQVICGAKAALPIPIIPSSVSISQTNHSWNLKDPIASDFSNKTSEALVQKLLWTGDVLPFHW